jgi:hypothetical protein
MLWKTKLIGLPPEKSVWSPQTLIAILLQVVMSACHNPVGGDEPENTEPDQKYTRWYVADENNYSPEEWQECLAVIEQLSSLGISLPERFKSLQDAKYVIEQRHKLANKAIAVNKPVTIVIHSYYDTMGAFSGKRNSLASIITHKQQQLLYFEIGSDADLKAALRLLKSNLPAKQELTLILAGHGDKDYLYWNWSTGSTLFYLDPTDYTDQEFINLLHGLYIKLAVFESCSAGQGGEMEQNQANRLAAHVRVGSRVIAPLVDALGATYTFDSSDSIQNVKYSAWTTNPSGDPGNIAYSAYGQFVP